MIDLTAVKGFLSDCDRWELRDHALGDTEMGWCLNGVEIATGYFNGSYSHVLINPAGDNQETIRLLNFTGLEAEALRGCGTLINIERKDVDGPDIYIEGVVMKNLEEAIED